MARDKTNKTPAATLATTATQEGEIDTPPPATIATTATQEGQMSKGKQTVKKPTPDVETIHDLNEALRVDPDAEFVFRLHWRARTLLDGIDLPKAAVAFEMMQSAFSAFEGGLAHKDIAGGYPVTAWREDTVEIPRAWLRLFVEGWAKYKSSNTGSTLGEAFGVEGGGQGKQPVRERLDQLNRDIRLSNKAEFEYRVAQAEGGNAAWERAFHAVAAKEGVSEETVKRAHNKHKAAQLQRFEYFGLLNPEGGKAS